MSDYHADLPFNWVEESDSYVAETPYGKVVVTRVDDETLKRYSFGSHHYRLRIEYKNGETRSFHNIFESLGSAEGWAYLTLQEYDEAERKQSELDELLSTLELCRQMLARSADAAHNQRLQRIEEILKKHFGQLP